MYTPSWSQEGDSWQAPAGTVALAREKGVTVDLDTTEVKPKAQQIKEEMIKDI